MNQRERQAVEDFRAWLDEKVDRQGGHMASTTPLTWGKLRRIRRVLDSHPDLRDDA